MTGRQRGYWASISKETEMPHRWWVKLTNITHVTLVSRAVVVSFKWLKYCTTLATAVTAQG